eukprot:6185508-Pleurochrysis_carterae.AAC.3
MWRASALSQHAPEQRHVPRRGRLELSSQPNASKSIQPDLLRARSSRTKGREAQRRGRIERELVACLIKR